MYEWMDHCKCSEWAPCAQNSTMKMQSIHFVFVMWSCVSPWLPCPGTAASLPCLWLCSPPTHLLPTCYPPPTHLLVPLGQGFPNCGACTPCGAREPRGAWHENANGGAMVLNTWTYKALYGKYMHNISSVYAMFRYIYAISRFIYVNI